MSWIASIFYEDSFLLPDVQIGGNGESSAASGESDRRPTLVVGNMESPIGRRMDLESNEALTSAILSQYETEAGAKTKSVPAMLSRLDRAIYFHYASLWRYGDIVDAGVLVGGSTMALLGGSTDLSPRIKVFDWFKSGGAEYVSKWLVENCHCDEAACEDFRSIFDRNLADYQDRLDVYCGDITKSDYIQTSPLYFLGVDCCKSLALVYPLVKMFFPALIPGNSYVVHQDYLAGALPFIHISMELLNDYFEPVLDGGNLSDSFVFRCSREIPAPVINAIFADPESAWYYRMEDNLRLFSKIQTRLLYPRSKLMLGCSKAMYLLSMGRREEARKCLETARSAWPDVPVPEWIVQNISAG